jgi:8-oxo-dGTP pyrophosphatase MutT (NUDIX family)
VIGVLIILSDVASSLVSPLPPHTHRRPPTNAMADDVICRPCAADGQLDDAASVFQHAIPSHRLGSRHESLTSYQEAAPPHYDDASPKEFSLVVVLSSNFYTNDTSNTRILLGKKKRGFGKGFYNCFGGKLEKSKGEDKHPARGAVRELLEETGIAVPLSVMEKGSVGTINFTFEDRDVNKAMKVHLYCVFLSDGGVQDVNLQRMQPLPTVTIDANQIKGCDEIEPEWFDNVYDIPLHQMFADDTLWLTMLLKHYDDLIQQGNKLMFNAWFHFHPGGAQTNSIMHHYIQLCKCNNTQQLPTSTNQPQSTPKYTLEKRLFHALHLNHIHSPSIKEFKESWAMANAVRSFMKEGERMEYVIDVAGGHGALAAMFLLLVPNCRSAVVIDPAVVNGKEGVLQAWESFWATSDATTTKELRHRHECLRTGLRDELNSILRNKDRDKVQSTNVLVVACHACQHLTDETLQIASEYGVNAAVMPCCQKDHAGYWKSLTKRLAKGGSVSIGTLMDLLAAGKMSAWESGAKAGVKYQVKMKLMDESISPLQNRMILCKAVARGDEGDKAKMELAHQKLTFAYRRAHRDTEGNFKVTAKTTPEEANKAVIIQQSGASDHKMWCIRSLVTGVCIGTIATLLLSSNREVLN